ncbi:MAG: Lrp/AsnC family transcriptional regulator [Gordonia sp. (in: high G+C Gram-positive bacteria)]
MGIPGVHDSPTMDQVDVQIAHAIRVSPRVSFTDIADILDIPEQTVARRYRRMRRDGLLRVTVAVNPQALGEITWQVRVRCRPDGVAAVADALARRDDVSWISVHSAGWEVIFNLQATNSADSQELLTRLLPKAEPVLGVSPAAVLHLFIGGAPNDWELWGSVLSDEQMRALEATRIARPAGLPADSRATLTGEDRRIIDHLTRDGRTPYATIARALGTTAGKITRRTEHLLQTGVLFLDVDLAFAATRMTPTILWLTVEPRSLTAVGDTLAAHPNVPFAAALSGPANLSVVVMAASPADLYEFVSDTLGSIDGITGYELALIDYRVKQAAALTTGDLLAPPLPP